MSIFAKLRAGVTTASAEETQALAAELARALPADATLALHGDLGVGKTTFVQGLARGFGIADTVTSPTFNIFTLYRAAAQATSPISHAANDAGNLPAAGVARELRTMSHTGEGASVRTTLVHLDAYRLESAHQIDALMLEDFLTTPFCLAVEWPEKIAGWIPANAFHLTLGITADERHTVRLA